MNLKVLPLEPWMEYMDDDLPWTDIVAPFSVSVPIHFIYKGRHYRFDSNSRDGYYRLGALVWFTVHGTSY